MSTQAILASIKELSKDAQIIALQRALSDALFELPLGQRKAITSDTLVYVDLLKRNNQEAS